MLRWTSTIRIPAIHPARQPAIIRAEEYQSDSHGPKPIEMWLAAGLICRPKHNHYYAADCGDPRCSWPRALLYSLSGNFSFSIFAIRSCWDYGSEWAVAGILTVSGLGLCRRCDISIKKLRWMELLIFGVPAAFFCALNAIEVYNLASLPNEGSAAASGWRDMDNPISPWMILIFNYSLFIPNTPRARCPSAGNDDGAASSDHV